MLIKICVDIWRDVFDFFGDPDRRELALKFSEICDSAFSDICQKWLHEWTKEVCLGPIHITSPLIVPSSFVAPETELPDNITDFQEIKCSYMDTAVLQFLGRMQPLLHGVNLFGECSGKRDIDSEATRTALGHLLPLLNNGGIDTVTLGGNGGRALFSENFRPHFPAQFLATRRISLVQISTVELAELLLQWLGTRRGDGQPRVLICYFSQDLVELIIQQFINATGSPVSFFVRTYFSGFWLGESTTQNVNTNEQLLVRRTHKYNSGMFIGRCPAALDGQKWVQEMDELNSEANIHQQEKEGRRKIGISDLFVQEKNFALSSSNYRLYFS